MTAPREPAPAVALSEFRFAVEADKIMRRIDRLDNIKAAVVIANALEAAERRVRESAEPERDEIEKQRASLEHDCCVLSLRGAELERALRKYGRHDDSCAVVMIHRRFEPDCSCGLDAALSSSEAKP